MLKPPMSNYGLKYKHDQYLLLIMINRTRVDMSYKLSNQHFTKLNSVGYKTIVVSRRCRSNPHKMLYQSEILIIVNVSSVRMLTLLVRKKNIP